MALKFITQNRPINIDLKDFILEGKFDCLKLGVTKSWLQHNFIEPDYVMFKETFESSPIWGYGNIELHFNGDVLWMIFFDNVGELNGGDKIKLDKWILSSGKQTKIEDWVNELNRNTRNFRVVHSQELEQTKLILNEEENGVTLTFINGDEQTGTPNKRRLGAIQSWAAEFAFT